MRFSHSFQKNLRQPILTDQALAPLFYVSVSAAEMRPAFCPWFPVTIAGPQRSRAAQPVNTRLPNCCQPSCQFQHTPKPDMSEVNCRNKNIINNYNLLCIGSPFFAKPHIAWHCPCYGFDFQKPSFTCC